MMKKTILAIITVVGFGLSAGPALAATLTLSPTSITVKAGQSFTVAVMVDPQGGKDSTIKTVLSFPADMLSVQAFTQNTGWLSLTQPGYDLTDNTNGKLVKTAGFPGGITNTTTFGTVNFLAKKSGSANIQVTAESLVYDNTNKNVLGSVLGQTVVTINPAATPTPTVTKAVTPAPTKVGGQVTASPTPTVSEEAGVLTPTPTPDTLSDSTTARLGAALTLGTNKWPVAVLVLAILAGLLAWLIWGLRRRKNNL